jgi:hypothetical protein
LRKGSKSLGVIDLVAWIAVNAKKGLKLPIVLSGDTHHYSRYTGDDGVTQFITSGGGGAFLHPTHQLAPTIDINRESDGFSWLGGRVKTLTLGTDPDPDAGPAPNESLYPTRRDSIAMLAGNFEFVRYNAGFAALLGVLYWLVGLATQHLWPDVLYLAPVVLCLGFWRYTRQQEGGGHKVRAVSLANGVIHSVIAISLALFFLWVNERWLRLQDWPRVDATLFAAEMIVVGGTIAAASGSTSTLRRTGGGSTTTTHLAPCGATATAISCACKSKATRSRSIRSDWTGHPGGANGARIPLEPDLRPRLSFRRRRSIRD